jgi:hypothetical protein
MLQQPRQEGWVRLHGLLCRYVLQAEKRTQHLVHVRVLALRCCLRGAGALSGAAQHWGPHRLLQLQLHGSCCRLGLAHAQHLSNLQSS